VMVNALDGGVMLLGKGLVGYVDAPDGHRLAFAAYVNMVPLHDMNEEAGVGETLAQIAALAYRYAPNSTVPPKRAAPRRSSFQRKSRRRSKASSRS
jgi:hypothetical protein